jgi:SAM-dependent methyltransferase
MEGTLRCLGCSKEYPILRGVPRLLDGAVSQEQEATADAFGYEWTHFSQLEATYEDEFLDWIKPVGKAFFRDRIVLDGGCGKGRHAALAAAFGAKDVIGVDISDAVDAAFANTRDLPNVHVVQADIYKLPFEASFDYAYSIGVLHHLPDPKAGFHSLVRHLKPGGRMSAWVYGQEGNGWITHLVSPVRTLLTSRLPRALTKALSFCIAVPMQLALKILYRPVNQRLPAIRGLLFYNDYLYSISGFSFRENYSTVFDHLVAPTAFYISRQEFARWFEEAGLLNVDISWRNRNSWRGTGVTSAPAGEGLHSSTAPISGVAR